jgi:hypothetical protein
MLIKNPPPDKKSEGGNGWESNPPRPATRPATDFEDRETHRDLSTPRLRILYNPVGVNKTQAIIILMEISSSYSLPTLTSSRTLNSQKLEQEWEQRRDQRRNQQHNPAKEKAQECPTQDIGQVMNAHHHACHTHKWGPHRQCISEPGRT